MAGLLPPDRGSLTTGREILLDVLVSEGVRHCFGNPGSTELPFIDALASQSEIAYVLALQENVAVAMADGYAQASGRPSFVNLHTVAGLGGGMGNLTNAAANRTPMVVTAGQADRRHLLAEPILSGDLCGLARPATKWQHEVRQLGELGPVLRRAFLDARRPPAGPVFVSIPMDVLDDTGDVTVPDRSEVVGGAVAGGLDELASVLTSLPPGRTVVVVGDEVAAGGALAEVVALAEALGAPVYGTPLHSNLNFPATHALWRGMLPMTAQGIAGILSAYDQVFVVGGKAFLVYPWSPGPPVPASVALLHLSAVASDVGRDLPTRLGLVGDIRASLTALVPLVRRLADADAVRGQLERAGQERLDADEQARRRAAVAVDQATVPMAPLAALSGIVAALPPGTAVVDEAITSGLQLRTLLRCEPPGAYYFARGGGLGWGLGAALGVQLARPDTPVVCVIGDGSAMYAIQALWTAAHENLPVVFTVVNNRQYAILKRNLVGAGSEAARAGRFVGLDLDEPPVDFVTLARSLGVGGSLVEKAADVPDAVRGAFASGRPTLLEIPIAPPS